MASLLRRAVVAAPWFITPAAIQALATTSEGRWPLANPPSIKTDFKRAGVIVELRWACRQHMLVAFVRMPGESIRSTFVRRGLVLKPVWLIQQIPGFVPGTFGPVPLEER